MSFSKGIRAISNTIMMWSIRMGVPLPPYSRRNALIVETIGRRSGRRWRNPVGYVDADGRLLVVAERGAAAHWVRNALERDGRLRIYLRREWRDARLRLLEGDPEDYLQRMNKRHAAFVRRLATAPQALEITPE